MRWFATGIIALLLLLIVVLPLTPIANGRPEAVVRSDVPGAVGQIGRTLPPLFLQDLDGRPLRLADFRGHPLLITFERSVDW